MRPPPMLDPGAVPRVSDAEQLLLGRGELLIGQRAVLMQPGELLELLGDRCVRRTGRLGIAGLSPALLFQAADPGILVSLLCGLVSLLRGLVRRSLSHLLARHIRATADHS